MTFTRRRASYRLAGGFLPMTRAKHFGGMRVRFVIQRVPRSNTNIRCDCAWRKGTISTTEALALARIKMDASQPATDASRDDI